MAELKSVCRIRCRLPFVLLLMPLLAFSAPAKVRVGVLPVYDQGGATFAPTFSSHLTAIIFRALERSSVDPVLLNPGGLYSGAQDDWTLEYAKQSQVDVLLITVLQRIDVPPSGGFPIRVKSELLDLKGARSIASWESSARVNKGDIVSENMRAWSGEGSRQFDKQPLGRAAREIAADVQAQVARAAAAVSPSSETALVPSQTGTCHLDFRVSYVAKHASSKSYDVVVNGRDETLSITDGVVPLTVQPGPLLIQLVVHDPPYKMPKQDVYQANTQVDCSPSSRNLSMEIGPAGEAFLKWR